MRVHSLQLGASLAGHMAEVIRLGTLGVSIVQWYSGLVHASLHSLFNEVVYCLVNQRGASAAMAFWHLLEVLHTQF